MQGANQQTLLAKSELHPCSWVAIGFPPQQHILQLSHLLAGRVGSTSSLPNGRPWLPSMPWILSCCAPPNLNSTVYGIVYNFSKNIETCKTLNELPITAAHCPPYSLEYLSSLYLARPMVWQIFSSTESVDLCQTENPWISSMVPNAQTQVYILLVSGIHRTLVSVMSHDSKLYVVWHQVALHQD